MENSNNLKWYQKEEVKNFLSIIIFPIGIYLMWKNQIFSKSTRWIITVVVFLFILGLLIPKGKLEGKKFIYSNVLNGSGAVLEFETSKKCTWFFLMGNVKQFTSGEYILEEDNLIFSWEDGVGPKSGKLVKENESLVILVGDGARYEEDKE
jgi:hypothetical protein